MQTYPSIIGRLTESQRIRLLTDFRSLSDPEMTALGVPTVTLTPLEALADGQYPSPTALARAWDPALVEEVTTAVVRNATASAAVDSDSGAAVTEDAAAGELPSVSSEEDIPPDPATDQASAPAKAPTPLDTACLFVPGAKAAVGTVQDSLSEEPILSGEIAGAILRGVHRAGSNACMQGYGIIPRHVGRARLWSRHPARTPDPRVVREHLTVPFAAALGAAPCLGVVTETDEILPPVATDATVRYTVRRRASDRDTVKALERGDILLEGSAIALQSALHTYRRLSLAIEHGRATTGELHAAMVAGEAISESTVQQALERLFAFAEACCQRPEVAPDLACTDGTTVIADPPDAEMVGADAVDPEAMNREAETDLSDVADDAVLPTAVEPTAVEPTAVEPTAVEPTAIDPTGVDPIGVDPIDGDPIDGDPDAIDPASIEALLGPETLATRAFVSTTVLLENRSHTLPLKKKTAFCLVGAPASAAGELPILGELCRLGKCTYLGYAQGYEPTADRSEDLLEPAVALAKGADVTILFLSANGHPEKDRADLPANRIALFDRLSALKKKLVVVLSADDVPDLRFLDYAAIPPAAVLLAPVHMTAGSEPVGLRYTLETLFGHRAPAGRLNMSAIRPDDPATERRGLLEGPFLGYRYYDTVSAGAHYPFGHGLTYTKFWYARLKVENDTVTFTIINYGRRRGVAVPQIYVGMPGSTVLRPRQELVSYVKVELEPMASATVSLPLRVPPVYTEEGAVIEEGTYTLSVGESVADIRLTTRVDIAGVAVPADEATASDYLPTVSNILTEHYTLEAEYTPMKASLRNPIFGVSALVLAACVKLVDLISKTNSILPDILAAVLAIGAVVFLVMELIDRKTLAAREQKQLDEINGILFAEAKKIAVPTADALFDEAPDADAVVAETAEVQAAAMSGEYDHFADVDRSLTFAVAADDLRRLAAAKGVDIDEATARSIFAALATTRLVVVKGMEDDQFHTLLSVLCEYLACPVCMDRVDSSYMSESSALFSPLVAQGERSMLAAIRSAQDRERYLHIAALTNVRWVDISAYFVPFAGYARTPYSANHLSVQDNDGRTRTYRLPKNLWFMLNLAEGESVGDIPDYIADVATVHEWTVHEAPAAESVSEFRQFHFGQMLYLGERVKSSFVLDEDMWKKIDRLEAYVLRYASDFRLGNKLWLGLETYLAVLCSTGVEVTAALDEALAVKLLPAIIRTLCGKLSREDQSLGETLDIIFGEDRTVGCRRAIKESGADIM